MSEEENFPMHEKTGCDELIDKILNHDANKYRDPHELMELAKILKPKSLSSLEQIFEILKLNPDIPTPTQ